MHVLAHLLRWLALGVVAIAGARAAESLPRPNILLFIADNWGWHAGALGDPVAPTPTFDRLAREGVLFTHAFCPVPSCTPTRSSILTGRPAHQLEDAGNLWSAFPRKFSVFTDLLRGAGYDVGMTGKGWGPGNFKDYGWTDNPVGKEFRGLREFLAARDQSRPFFFWLGNTDSASHRWRYGAGEADGLDAAKLRVPPEFPDLPETRATLLGYYAAVGRMDAQAAAAFALLQNEGLLENTVIIYTSDNGRQTPRGLGNCYDSGTRVPMVISWHKHLQGGRVENGFISLTDLGPSCLELAGVPIPDAMTGRSFVDQLLDRPGAVRRDHIFLERERHANVRRGDLSYPVRALRTRDYLYLWNVRPDRWPAGDPTMYYAVGDYGDVDASPLKELLVKRAAEPAIAPFHRLSFAKRPAEELYDLRSDPHEVVNIAGRPDVAKVQRELRARVEAWMRATADPRVDPDNDSWDRYRYFGPPPRQPAKRAP